MCRWLLSSFERAGSAELRLSHALLAHLLGARRQRVSEVTAELQRGGLIRYQRTSIRVLDRAGLECACECFAELRASYARLFEQALAALIAVAWLLVRTEGVEPTPSLG